MKRVGRHVSLRFYSPRLFRDQHSCKALQLYETRRIGACEQSRKSFSREGIRRRPLLQTKGGIWRSCRDGIEHSSLSGSCSYNWTKGVFSSRNGSETHYLSGFVGLDAITLDSQIYAKAIVIFRETVSLCKAILKYPDVRNTDTKYTSDLQAMLPLYENGLRCQHSRSIDKLLFFPFVTSTRGHLGCGGLLISKRKMVYMMNLW